MAKFLGPWALYFYALHLSEAMFPGCYRVTVGDGQVDGRFPPPHIIKNILRFVTIRDFYALREAYRNWDHYDNQLDLLDNFLLSRKWIETLRSPTEVIHIVEYMRDLSPDFGTYGRIPGFHDGFFELYTGDGAHSSIMDHRARYRFESKQKRHAEVETQDVDYDARVRMYMPHEDIVDEVMEMAYVKILPNAVHLIAKRAGRKINLATLHYDINCHIWQTFDSPTVHDEVVGTLPLRVKFNKPIRPQYRGAVHDALNWDKLEKLWFMDSSHPTRIEPAKLMTVDVLARSRHGYEFCVDKYKEDGLPPEWFYGESTPFYQEQAFINRIRWQLMDYGRMMQ